MVGGHGCCMNASSWADAAFGSSWPLATYESVWRGQAALVQPWGLTTRSVEAGYLSSRWAGLVGLGSNAPPQLGQMPLSVWSAQVAQKVHSKEQMRASVDSGGKTLSQHSQEGRSCSIGGSSFGAGFDWRSHGRMGLRDWRG